MASEYIVHKILAFASLATVSKVIPPSVIWYDHLNISSSQ